MLESFLNFVLEVFRMIVTLFQETSFGSFTYEQVLIAILVLLLITRVVMVRIR